MDFKFELGLIALTILVGVYYYVKSSYNFWKSLGVPGPEPELLFGNIKDVLTSKKFSGLVVKKIYDTYKEHPVVGIYRAMTPVALVNDLDLIKDILIRDFSKFVDRGQPIHERHEPLAQHLFNLEPKRWRPLRAKLSPIFTSGKLKDMFYLIINCADQLEKYLDEFDNEIVDMRDIPARFTTDVIGLCVFGLEANALKDKNSELRRMGKRIFDVNAKIIGRIIFGYFFPTLYHHILGYFFRDNETDNFILGITKQTMEYRKKNNINRHDFIDLLLALKEQPQQVNDVELTDKVLAAQTFAFFGAGFETSATTIANALYELAQNHSIQDKLRQEIKEELAKTGGKLTYDGIKNMKYLDQVFKETLRKYSPVAFLTRRSMEPYEFTGTGIRIPTNTLVWIPIFAIQRDPQYFPKPEVFDPERFSDENVKTRHDMTFLPFGDGPRNCIGARFAIIQTKVGLIKILQHHSVDVCEKTDLNYEVNIRALLLLPKNGIFLRINKVK